MSHDAQCERTLARNPSDPGRQRGRKDVEQRLVDIESLETLFLGEAAEPFGALGAEWQDQAVSGVAGANWRSAVERRRRGPSGREPSVFRAPASPLVLRIGGIGGQRRVVGGAAVQLGGVGAGHFVEDQRARRGVGHEVMLVEEPDPVPVGQLDQRRIEGFLGQIEAVPDTRVDPVAGFRLAPDPEEGERPRGIRKHPLAGRAVALLEDDAQSLAATHDAIEGAAEGFRVHRQRQIEAPAHVVVGNRRRQLLTGPDKELAARQVGTRFQAALLSGRRTARRFSGAGDRVHVAARPST